MEHTIMFAYQKYLLETGGDDELNIHRRKKYCDGSMQKYLETKWNVEHDNIKRHICNVSFHNFHLNNR